MSAKKAWATIEELARYEEDGWNDPVALGEGSLNYENPDIEQLLGVMEWKVREEIRIEQNRYKKIKKITRYPDTEDLEPLNDHKFSETLTKEVPAPPPALEWVLGEVPKRFKSQHDVAKLSLQSTPQVLSSFEEYTPPMTYLEEVEETFGTSIEVEPLDETQLEDLGLNTCNHDIPLSYREVPIFDEPKPQPQPLLNSPSLDVSLGDVTGPELPIKPHSLDSSRMKVVDYLTTHTPSSPHVASFHPKDTESRDVATLSGLRNAEMINATRLTHSFWPSIGDDMFNVGNTKAQSIRNPRIKLAHRCIMMTITGRKENTNRVTKIDLFYLYCIFGEGEFM
ncbi:hypothetical protein Tco_1361289 [Tanacetum coccineum]